MLQPIGIQNCVVILIHAGNTGLKRGIANCLQERCVCMCMCGCVCAFVYVYVCECCVLESGGDTSNFIQPIGTRNSVVSCAARLEIGEMCLK